MPFNIPNVSTPPTPEFEARLRRLLRGLFRVNKFQYDGLQHVPPSGPCVLASNHQAYYDPVFIAIALETTPSFMAWNAFFDGGFFSRMMCAWGSFPVDPDGKDPGGFREGLRRLHNGERVGVFPEGERCLHGHMNPFREGFARLAMHAAVPVVPVCLWGADKAWPRGDFAPRPFFPIRIRFLPPVVPQKAASPVQRRIEAKRITTEVQEAIQAALDQFDRAVL